MAWNSQPPRGILVPVKIDEGVGAAECPSVLPALEMQVVDTELVDSDTLFFRVDARRKGHQHAKNYVEQDDHHEVL